MILQVNLPHPSDNDLVRRCVEYLNPYAPAASVRPLGRFGYTNSRLYLVYCAPRDGGMPFVVKTDRAQVVEREARGVDLLKVYFAGAQSARIFPVGGIPEAIIYPLVSLDGGEGVRELREMVYRSESDPDGGPSSEELVTETYRSCRMSHVTSPKRITFGPEYLWYLRNTPERLLSDPLPNLFENSPSVDVYGHKLLDPRRIFDAVAGREVDTVVCPVHGDLHPNNVLFGPRFNPVLIDYAFGHLDGHFIKDFVLMECSLRFLLSPRLIQPDILGRFDDALLNEDGYEAAVDLAATGRAAKVLGEMGSLVRAVRKACRERHPTYEFREFLLAQYLVLTGLLRLFPYQEFRTFRALCGLADYIERTGIS